MCLIYQSIYLYRSIGIVDGCVACCMIVLLSIAISSFDSRKNSFVSILFTIQILHCLSIYLFYLIIANDYLWFTCQHARTLENGENNWVFAAFTKNEEEWSDRRENERKNEELNGIKKESVSKTCSNGQLEINHQIELKLKAKFFSCVHRKNFVAKDQGEPRENAIYYIIMSTKVWWLFFI